MGSCVEGPGDVIVSWMIPGAEQVARCAYDAGFRGPALLKAVAIAKAESGFSGAIHRPHGGCDTVTAGKNRWLAGGGR